MYEGDCVTVYCMFEDGFVRSKGGKRKGTRVGSRGADA